MIDFSKQLIRCSSIGAIMSNGRAKGSGMGDTAKGKLEQIYLEATTSRKKEYSSKHIEKGLACEEDAITLLSRHKKKFFTKNTERLNNDWLTGEPDIIDGKEGFDTKCSWDIWTFPRFDTKLDSTYENQNHGYIDLTGAEKWTTVYCLVNATADAIDSEKKSIYYKLGCPDENDPVYIEKLVEIEKNMIFDMAVFKKHNPYYDLMVSDWTYDLPMKHRIKEFVTMRDDEAIEAIHNRIENECRPYLDSLNYL